MLRHRAFLIFPAVAAVLVGCRGSGSDPVPASLPGSYVYAGQGSTFNHPWQFSARLDLTPDRRYTLTLDKTIEGKKDPTETNVGSFRVSGDHILLREDAGLPDKSHDMHKLRFKSDSLIAEVGWTAELFIKGIGAPNIVFVKQRRG
ncbi:MAG TPA: hypothetical protein VGJ47_05180 [Gemmatimonadaceae bacterium]|jgi:hypothetical protein